MEEDEERPKVNLHQHQRHKRQFSWQFVFKILMGMAVIAMMWYFSQLLMKTAQEQPESTEEDEIQIEISP